MKETLNLFYEELDSDRWLPLDRYPRTVARRLLRGTPRPGGQTRLFLNLRAGLEQIGVAYRVNDYRYLRRHTEELACVVGKPHVLDKMRHGNPILFGAAVFSHPMDDPELLQRLPVKKILVPGEWMRKMCEPTYGDRVVAWPVGIDTAKWSPSSPKVKDIDVLVYDKIRWQHDSYEVSLLNPIRTELNERGLRSAELRYGFYEEMELRDLLARSRAMIFLCEHETQGIAYQQALSCGVPILAWDRGGYWQDPSYYPHKVRFEPVSSVPYWDNRCGVKFTSYASFANQLREFCDGLEEERFDPRGYILEHLTLAKCADSYIEQARECLK
jgi:hypothetical protein